MKNEYQLQPESTSLYFDLQADFGITKHMGGRKATRELAELCHIQEGCYVLEVGCGIGTTACYLATEYGCQVAVVDISEKMLARAMNRAKKRGVETRVEFRVADAQQLPFVNRKIKSLRIRIPKCPLNRIENVPGPPLTIL